MLSPFVVCQFYTLLEECLKVKKFAEDVSNGHNGRMKKGGEPSFEPYKGVRDFYPEDQFVLHYLFEHMSRVCELFGYEEYGASILEHSELYRAKTSEEIVN